MSFIYVPLLIHAWDMTDLYRGFVHVWHCSFVYVTRYFYSGGRRILVDRIIIDVSNRYDMTHSYVWHDLYIYETWIMHTCDMTHSYRVHSRAWRGSFIYISHGSFKHVMWLIHMCDMTRWFRVEGGGCYGVATVSRIDKIVGLFCRISPLL